MWGYFLTKVPNIQKSINLFEVSEASRVCPVQNFLKGENEYEYFTDRGTTETKRKFIPLGNLSITNLTLTDPGSSSSK